MFKVKNDESKYQLRVWEPSFSQCIEWIDYKRLYSLRWKTEGYLENDEKEFARIKSLAVRMNLIIPKVIYIQTSVFKRGNNLIVRDNNFTFNFPGKKRSLINYFEDHDVPAVFYLTTSGYSNESGLRLTDKFFLHGIASEIAVVLAEQLVNKIKRENNINFKPKTFSPGYAVWPDLSDQKKLCSMLKCEMHEISITDSFQIVPECSTSGIMIIHRESEYITPGDQ